MMFKKLTLLLSLFAVVTMTAQNPINRQTVSMGAGYAQNVWYNLATDAEVKGTASGWNLAISVRPFDAGIWIHPFDNLYRAVNSGANFATVSATDTSLATAARQLYNSDTSWNVGAVNRTLTGLFDYGWGAYNQVSNNVVGDSTYLFKMQNGTWKKIFIEKLSYDTSYFIRVADLDGANLKVYEVNKKSFVGKNFVYLNLNSGAVLDLEPANTAWDLVFTRYQTAAKDPVSGQLAPYVVAGALQNTRIDVIRGQGVLSGNLSVRRIGKDTANDVLDQSKLATKISNIGGDWKVFTGTAWLMADSLTYFVKAQNNRFYKLIFKDFGGAANGNFVFTKETLGTTNIQNPMGTNAALAISPNPVIDGNMTVVYDFGYAPQNADFQLISLTGQVVYRQKLANTEGVQTLTLPTQNWASGLYFAQIRFDKNVLTQKVVVR